jgi:hypothetical protein
MARGSNVANQAATTAINNSNTLMGSGSSIGSFLAPELESQAANPQGYSPTDMAAMDTASLQSAGGGQAGAVGAGGLRAARSRNAGGADAASAEAGRDATAAVSRGALGSKIANAEAKTGERSQALSGLGNLYGTNVSGSNQALGIVPQAVNANTNAENASWNWANYLLDPLLSAGGAAAGAAAGAAKGCWIAEAIYGVDDIRTHTVRAWLNGSFRQSFMGDLVMRFYLKFGQLIAAQVYSGKISRSTLKPLFDMAFRKATAG